MKKNFWNTFHSALENSGKQDAVIKSIIWNTIISIFLEIKKIDITPYLISIKINWDTILVKTTKPAINFELNNIKEQIKKASLERLKKLGLWTDLYEIKFI